MLKRVLPRVLSIAMLAALLNTAVAEIKLPGVAGDGKTDDTDAMQKILGPGGEITIPAGTYLVGSLTISSNTTLRLSPGSSIKIAIERVKAKKLLTLGGNHITIEGINFDLTSGDGKVISSKQLETLISGQDVGDVTIRRLRAIGSAAPDNSATLNAISATNCHDFKVTESQTSFVQNLVTALNCERFHISDNRSENGKTITHWRDSSRSLTHTGNWSRNVVDQCLWWGGDSDDTHKWVPENSANIVQRDVRPGEKGYSSQTAGAYDILVHNNYAELGRTLAWGSKGRNVIITSNIARFMSDMAYDTEGGENVIISNNISTNSQAAGIGCYFWNQKIVISGNLIQVIPEGDAKYQGQFLRLHGPGSGSHFGAGETLVTGNVFVNETTEYRRLSIEACRYVTVQNNKFVNGGISTINTSRFVTIAGNTFDTSLTDEFSPIAIAAGTLEATINNNILKRVADNDDARLWARPAISIMAKPEMLRIVTGNQIRGWPIAIDASTSDPDNGIRRVIVRGNLLDGSIVIPHDPLRWMTQAMDNVDMKTLRSKPQENNTQ